MLKADAGGGGSSNKYRSNSDGGGSKPAKKDDPPKVDPAKADPAKADTSGTQDGANASDGGGEKQRSHRRGSGGSHGSAAEEAAVTRAQAKVDYMETRGTRGDEEGSKENPPKPQKSKLTPAQRGRQHLMELNSTSGSTNPGRTKDDDVTKWPTLKPTTTTTNPGRTKDDDVTKWPALKPTTTTTNPGRTKDDDVTKWPALKPTTTTTTNPGRTKDDDVTKWPALNPGATVNPARVTLPPPAGQAQPPGQAQQPAVDPAAAQKDATELYRAMKGGLTGWGTDEQAIFNTLKGKTPEQIAEIKRQYQQHYNASLDEHLKTELSGNELLEAQNLLKADSASAAANLIQQNRTHVFGQSSEIMGALENASPEERLRIAKSYAQQYGGNANDDAAAVAFMQRSLKDRMSATQNQQITQLMAASLVKDPNQAAQLNVSAATTKLDNALNQPLWADKDTVFNTLQNMSPEERALLAKNDALRNQLSSRLSGADRDRAMSLLAGNTAGEDAAKLQTALNGWFGADKAEVQRLLENKKPEEIAALRAAYRAQTGQELDAALNTKLDGDARTIANSLLTTGRASEADKLHAAMAGWGTDEQAIRDALKGKTKEEIAAIRQEYQARFHTSLDADLASELGGRDKFEVDQLMRGAPQTAQQQLANLEEQRTFERGWSSGVIDWVNNVTKGQADGQRLDTQIADAKAYLSQANADGVITAQEQQVLNQKLGYASDDVKTYQDTKDSAGEAAATAAVAVTTTAAVVATGGAATPLAIAGYAALGAGTRVAAQSFVQGQALGTDGMFQQAAIGALEGGTVVLPGSKGLGAVAHEAEAVAVKTATEDLSAAAVRERIRASMLQGMREGAFQGGITGGAQTAMDSETWRDGVLKGTQRVLTSTATNTLMGAAGGAIGGGGMEWASEASRPLRTAAGEYVNKPLSHLSQVADYLGESSTVTRLRNDVMKPLRAVTGPVLDLPLATRTQKVWNEALAATGGSLDKAKAWFDETVISRFWNGRVGRNETTLAWADQQERLLDIGSTNTKLQNVLADAGEGWESKLTLAQRQQILANERAQLQRGVSNDAKLMNDFGSFYVERSVGGEHDAALAKLLNQRPPEDQLAYMVARNLKERQAIAEGKLLAEVQDLPASVKGSNTYFRQSGPVYLPEGGTVRLNVESYGRVQQLEVALKDPATLADFYRGDAKAMREVYTDVRAQIARQLDEPPAGSFRAIDEQTVQAAYGMGKPVDTGFAPADLQVSLRSADLPRDPLRDPGLLTNLTGNPDQATQTVYTLISDADGQVVGMGRRVPHFEYDGRISAELNNAELHNGRFLAGQGKNDNWTRLDELNQALLDVEASPARETPLRVAYQGTRQENLGRFNQLLDAAPERETVVTIDKNLLKGSNGQPGWDSRVMGLNTDKVVTTNGLLSFAASLAKGDKPQVVDFLHVNRWGHVQPTLLPIARDLADRYTAQAFEASAANGRRLLEGFSLFNADLQMTEELGSSMARMSVAAGGVRTEKALSAVALASDAPRISLVSLGDRKPMVSVLPDDADRFITARATYYTDPMVDVPGLRGQPQDVIAITKDALGNKQISFRSMAGGAEVNGEALTSTVDRMLQDLEAFRKADPNGFQKMIDQATGKSAPMSALEAARRAGVNVLAR